MAIVNLRKHYYPLYTKDTFVEVPDEVAAVMEECRLYENRQEGRKSYYHVYSMDCSPGIENHAMFLVQSPEDLIIREIDEAAEELLLAHLAEAITHLSPTQARRLHARCQRQLENVIFRRDGMSFFGGQHAMGMQP